MRALRALGPSVLVGGGFAILVVSGLGASWLFAAASGAAIGLAIWAVVASRPTERDRLAEEAWRQAAPDLPPVSDRRELELSQADMPGPEKRRAAISQRSGDARHGAVR